ncbi:response regulator [Paenibacillus agricola]|uniref:histidine kinase n=1 Tax=Paenibacillus agricola TaxID=2716264 RepID=A0ABX0J5S3_9BACL|nr:response regulator [Paenibacillus agricola]NHN31685.1 response regulator [Paenibacillus agricola]
MQIKTKLGMGIGILLGIVSSLTAIILSQPANSPSTFAIILLFIGLAVGIGTIIRVFKRMNEGTQQLAAMTRHIMNEQIAAPPQDVHTNDEFGSLSSLFQQTAVDVLQKLKVEKELRLEMEKQAWIKSHIADVMLSLQGIHKQQQAAQMFMNTTLPLLRASYGTVYIKEAADRLTFTAGYAIEEDHEQLRREVQLGRGLIGQCALDRTTIVLNEVPVDYIKVNSSLGKSAPVQLIVHPVLYQEEVMAVIEVASLQALTVTERQLLDELCYSLGILLNSIMDRNKVDELYFEVQTQKEELQAQSEELQAQNEELQAQTEELQAQTEELQAQTEELQVQSEELMSQQAALEISNADLERKTDELQLSEEELQLQQAELEDSNQQLVAKAQQLEAQFAITELQKRELEQQTHDLELSNQYKSEFLANMSHELRTPLNSLLILSQLLGENRNGRMDAKQVEYAHTIHSSGSDLLRLINEILDLSKVESGKMDITIESVRLEDIKDVIWKNFQPVALKKDFEFSIEISEELPDSIEVDGYRLQQILRNLISNALKFTSEGKVLFEIEWAPVGAMGEFPASPEEMIAFKVTDTGIGIPDHKQDSIFDAFQQVDGTTTRNYGGTGLGLTISRKLAQLMGGDIDLQSTEGQGSSFTLYLPVTSQPVRQPLREVAAAIEAAHTNADSYVEGVLKPVLQLSDPVLLAPSEIDDDRYMIRPEDQVLLLIEDDIVFAKVILDMARSRGFKTIVALQGDKGIALAKTYIPDAIILDMHLPVMDGWSVLNYLKIQSETRHIPIFVMSVLDEIQEGLSRGAFAYVKKPIDKEIMEKAFTRIESFIHDGVKRLLIVEKNMLMREDLVKLIGHEDVHITDVSNGEAALAELSNQHFNCIIMGLELTDISHFELLERIKTNAQLRTIPIIIYTGKALSKEEELLLKKYADSIIIKNVQSKKRLFDEASLFLHRVQAKLPEDKQQILLELNNPHSALEGKKVLLVDDDMRNIFAVSGVLEKYHIRIMFAQNGQEALEVLEQMPDMDLILMDIMMPVMDGYEAMRRIRQMPVFEQLPIIALTAKAMLEDRIKCLDAGASDYISKPINPDQLFSLLKVWLYK